MDGVIVDSHPIHRRSWSKLLNLRGKEINEKDLNFIMDGRKREEILRYFFGHLSDEQVQLLGHQKEQLFREEATGMKLIEGALRFLAAIPAKRKSKLRCGFIRQRKPSKRCSRFVSAVALLRGNRNGRPSSYR